MLSLYACALCGAVGILQCSTAIGVAVLLPFLGVSSLNFGPPAKVAFFLFQELL